MALSSGVVTFRRTAAGLAGLVFALTVLAAAARESNEAEIDRAMRAFYENNYRAARRLASRHGNDPRGLLVLAFCDIHDVQTRDWKRGIDRLGEIVRKTDEQPELQRAVKISIVNTVEALRGMNQLPAGVSVDVDAVCREFLAADPPEVETWEALMIMGWRAISLDRGEEQRRRLDEIEGFLERHGDRPETSAACKLLGEFYVHRGDVERGVRWLDRSIEHELVNPMMNVNSIMVLARTRHRLGDVEGAKAVYRLLLERFPLDRRAANARRFLDELENED